jgi:hypothetical protein
MFALDMYLDSSVFFHSLRGSRDAVVAIRRELCNGEKQVELL